MTYQFEYSTIKNCATCPCLHWGEYQAFEKSWCALNSKVNISKSKRPIDCPLELTKKYITDDYPSECDICNVGYCLGRIKDKKSHCLYERNDVW